MTTVSPAALSDREAEVLAAVADRLTNAQVAARLHISVRTVESHVSSLLRKLGAADRRELAALSVDANTRGAVATDDVLGLPSAWTSFIGREAELADVLHAL